MTDNEKITVGDNAKRLIDNEAFNLAIERMKFKNFSSFCNVKQDDIESMKNINLQMSAITDLERELKDIVIDGNQAKEN